MIEMNKSIENNYQTEDEKELLWEIKNNLIKFK